MELVGDEEALGAVAGLSVVVQARIDGGLHRRVEVVGRQQDERVGAAQLQNDLLEVAPRDLGDGGSRALAAGHRDAVHTPIGDDLGGLIVGQTDIDVRADGEARIGVDLGDRGGRLGALRRMLEQDGVADRQVRRREARDLVVREVPRHDAQKHAQRRAADHRGALPEDVDGPVAGDLVDVIGVELRDVGGEVDLTLGRSERFAHLPHDDRGQLVAALAMQFGDAAQQRRTIRRRRGAPPRLGRLVRGRDGGLDLGGREVGVGGERLAGGGVHNRIRHRRSPFVSTEGRVASGAGIRRGSACTWSRGTRGCLRGPPHGPLRTA